MLSEDLRLWVGKIDKLINDLKEMTVFSEDDVSKIGITLQTLFDTSKSVANNASQITELIGSNKIEKQSINLKETLKEIENSVNKITYEIGTNSKKIEDLILIINKNFKPIESFKRIVKQLIALSINTKIENSRLGNNNNGFFMLAQDVEKLSGVINKKCSNILSKIKNLQQELEKTNKIFLESQTLEKGIAKEIITNIFNSLSSITEHKSLSIQTAEKIKNNLNKINEDISRIIISLQFHDITRQQIEHVIEAIYNDTKEISAFLDTNRCNDSEMILKLSKLIDILGLQIEQIKNSRDEFVDAINMAIDILYSIAAKINNTIEDILVLTGSAENKEHSYLVIIENVLNSVVYSLEEEVETNRRLIEEMHKIFSTVSELINFADEIEDISIEIELTALNARIKAARVGREGAALGILSEAIQKLSDITYNNSEKVIDTLIEFDKEISSLKHHIEKMISDGQYSINQIKNKINEQIFFFHEIEDNIIKMIKKTEYESKTILLNIDKLIKETTIHEKVNRLLTEVTETMKQIITGASAYAQKDNNDNNLKNLHLLYTMEKEREIHKMYKSDLRHIEKAMPFTQKSLGNNVELF